MFITHMRHRKKTEWHIATSYHLMSTRILHASFQHHPWPSTKLDWLRYNINGN